MAEKKVVTLDVIDGLDPEDIDAALDVLEEYSVDTDEVGDVADAQRKLRQLYIDQQKEDEQDSGHELKKTTEVCIFTLSYYHLIS